ncbi:MAG: amidohydrolase family protein [Planctomycetia bacterium]|nr:amidohydrolase family protein [Planctomycetia bacterium]
MTLDRREFLRRSGQTALAMGSLGLWAAPERSAAEDAAPAPAMPIIDTHQHLWDLDKFHLPWLKSAGPLDRSFVTKDYLEATGGLNVVKAVYMEVALATNEQLAEAQYVIDLCRRGDSPTVAGVIAGQLGTPGFAAYIRRFEGSPYIKGVRQSIPAARVEQGLVKDGDFLRDLRLLGELGMSFDLCTAPELLPAGEKLVAQCPDTRFIVDHCGNADPRAFRPGEEKPSHDPDQWRRDMGSLAGRKNTVCKISGIISRIDPKQWSPEELAPVVNHCLEVFGPDRVMFAGDWPVCTRGASLREWVGALKQIVADRPDEQRRKLFHDNAFRVYGLG